MRRILFPVDFSARCRGAAAYVEAMAGRFDAELTLLHVVEPPTYNSSLEEPLVVRPESFDQFLGADLKYLRVSRMVEHGEAARKIVECAQALGADLIMLPTQGKGIFRRLLLGSTAAKVLHDADCPVWTGVHLENAPPLDAILCRRIVCAIDLHESSARVFEWARGLADEYQAELTLVHAVPKSGRSAAMDVIERLQSSAGTRVAVRLCEGDPARAVTAMAADLKADLMVIGRRSLGGPFGRLEMTAYAIIRESPCPVVSV